MLKALAICLYYNHHKHMLDTSKDEFLIHTLNKSIKISWHNTLLLFFHYDSHNLRKILVLDFCTLFGNCYQVVYVNGNSNYTFIQNWMYQNNNPLSISVHYTNFSFYIFGTLYFPLWFIFLLNLIINCERNLKIK